jgi:hypothetical protein
MLTSKQIDQAGGRAFPHDEKDSGGQHWQSHDGMTLRDYFAAQALVSMGTWMPPGVSDFNKGHLDSDEVLTLRARWSYAQADAMLEARKR